jgi:hypothetical protein
MHVRRGGRSANYETTCNRNSGGLSVAVSIADLQTGKIINGTFGAVRKLSRA